MRAARFGGRALAAASLALALLATLPAAALAGPQEPVDPELAMPEVTLLGSQGWRTQDRFEIEWRPVAGTFSLTYELLGAPWATGTHLVPLDSGATDGGGRASVTVSVPPPPGATEAPSGSYQVVLWLEDKPHKRSGPATTLNLNFDDSRPAPAQPTAPEGWLDPHQPIAVAIAHPAAPLPPSGIRGYAVSITSHPDEPPCLDPAHCTDAEVDLSGIGNDRLDLGPQPEGLLYVHVAAVSNTGVASVTADAPVRVDAGPPTIRFSGLPLGWVDHPVQVTATAVDPLSGTAPAGPSGPFTALAVDGGVPTSAAGGVVTAIVAGEGVHRLSGWGRDAVGNTGAAATGQTATVRIDETPPRVAFAAAQRPDDPELIRVGVDDALAGPSEERGSIGFRPAGTGAPFSPLTTTAGLAGLSARWPSDDYPPGPYEFRAVGFDAAGNSATTTSRADGSPMILRNPIKTPTRIESGFGGARLVWQRCHRAHGQRRCHREIITDYDQRPTIRTVPFGRPLRFGGVLADAAGHPLAHQQVEIVETFSAGSDAGGRETTVTTDGHGAFGVRLAPGPSRRVAARFAGTRTLTRTVGAEVGMAVRAGLRLHASTAHAEIGGRPVIFSGRLFDDEATIPRTGRPVRLEFRIPGGTWSEFRTVQTDRRGRFRYPYAFTDDDSRGIRFQFRAVSPEQAGWPYRPAASAPVAVTGH